MLYVWYLLNLRNVEDFLFKYSVDINHETVRFWWYRFGPINYEMMFYISCAMTLYVRRDWRNLTLVAAILIMALAFDRRGNGLPEWKWPRALGDASYSIYLFHFLPILFLHRIGRYEPVSDLTYFIVVTVVRVGGELSIHYRLEHPLMLAFKRSRQNWREQSSIGRTAGKGGH